MKNRKKVFVSGCFDMLHSGHVAFFTEAAAYGDVYVGLGSDETIYELKGRYPVNNQDERKYMIKALGCITDCFVNTGSGVLDFVNELKSIEPEIFIVNEDGNTPAKEELIKKMGIEYLVLKRIPFGNLPTRSTTSLRNECTIPYRIDIAGGWLDQPLVGRFSGGPVITVSIEPTIEFNEKSGMASSTRRKAIELWNASIPAGDKEKLAKVLFSFENQPGAKIISGSQDSIGIVFPGLNKLEYKGRYWPENIVSVYDEKILGWLENHLYLVSLGPRETGYDVLDNTVINKENATELSEAAEKCWDAILSTDLEKFGYYFKKSFEAQIKLFPNMVHDDIFKAIDKYKRNAHGWKLSGAGGGGYLIFIAPEPVEGAIRIKIRRKEP